MSVQPVEETYLEALEACVREGDRDAADDLLRAFRKYREKVKEVLSRRWGDGTIDGATASAFADDIKAIEEGEDL